MEQFETGNGDRWLLTTPEAHALLRQLETVNKDELSRFDQITYARMSGKLSLGICSINAWQMDWLTNLLERTDAASKLASNQASTLRAQIRAVINGED